MTHIIAISGFNIAVLAGALLDGSRQVVGIRAAVIAILMIIAASLHDGSKLVPYTTYGICSVDLFSDANL